jgi:hypothetical protein
MLAGSVVNIMSKSPVFMPAARVWVSGTGLNSTSSR